LHRKNKITATYSKTVKNKLDDKKMTQAEKAASEDITTSTNDEPRIGVFVCR